MEHDLISAINRIEDGILNNSSAASYKVCLITSMCVRGYTIGTCKEIISKKVLMCDDSDLNLCVAMKFGLNFYDICLADDRKNQWYVWDNLYTDEPMNILNTELKACLLEAKKLISEIEERFVYQKEEDSDKPLYVMFDKEEQSVIIGLMETVYQTCKFDQEVELEFTRKNDRTGFLHKAEYANTVYKQNTGFSSRPLIKDEDLMWYENDYPKYALCVTTNVKRPLSVAYISGVGYIQDIVERKANDSIPYKSKYECMYILEAVSGWFEKNNIHEGDLIRMKEVIK